MHLILAFLLTLPVTCAIRIAVKKCPVNKATWHSRERDFVCISPEEYHCILDEKDILMETCMVPIYVNPSDQDGCPWALHKENGKTIIGSVFNPCGGLGCPNKNDSYYWTNQLYRYPLCLHHYLQTTIRTTGSKISGPLVLNTSDFSTTNPDTSHDTEENKDHLSLILGLVTGLVGVVVISIVAVWCFRIKSLYEGIGNVEGDFDAQMELDYRRMATTTEDECRYGRMCLLVLEVSRNVLRRVIDHQSSNSLYNNFEEALNYNIHGLFHLWFRNCCCGNINNHTPLTKLHWDSLYRKVSTVLRHRARGECPCSYQAISGVTPDVLNISLCCLILKIVFPSVLKSDVDKIYNIHNDIINANNACIDCVTFQNEFTVASHVLNNLSRSVSVSYTNDTNTALRILDKMLIDSRELQVLVSIMKDHKDYADLNNKINRLQAVQLSSEDTIQTVIRRLQVLQSQLHQLEDRQGSHERIIQSIIKKETQTIASNFPELQLQVQQTETTQITYEIENINTTTTHASRILQQQDVQGLRNELVEMYQSATLCIPVMPFGDARLPLNQLFSEVVVAEDIKSNRMLRTDMPTERKPIKTVEIFYNDDKPVQRIFMKGKAGRGKTVYGYNILEEWCKVRQGNRSDMQNVLSQFEFLFHVSMRHVKENRTRVVDMICDSISKGNPKQEKLIQSLLNNEDICCLIVLDGLDEWSSDCNNFPDTDGLVKCVLFTSSRPWKLEELQIDYTPQDKVIEILGINPESIDSLITRVVTHLYDDVSQSLINELKQYCKERAQDPKMKELMKLPMILTASCHLWCEEFIRDSKSQNDKSMTYFSLAIIDILIQRAEKNDAEVKDYLKKQRQKESQPTSITNTMIKFLREFFPKIIDALDILIPFCKVAYNDLMSEKTLLVFRREQLEKEVGEHIVALALKIGFVSKCKAPGYFNVINVSISFFHKLIQELMAAMYVAFDPERVTISNLCQSMDKVLDLSNVIMYITGLDSSLGCMLSHHVKCIANDNYEFLRWRETLDEHWGKVQSLYRTQCEWYTEMLRVTAMLGITETNPYYVPDVYLGYDDSEAVEVTRKLISNAHDTVASICMGGVSDISSIIECLPRHSTSLTSLGIVMCDVPECEILATVLPQFEKLQCIEYVGNYRSVDADVVIALTKLSRLKSIELRFLDVGNTKLSMAHMTQLENLILQNVDEGCIAALIGLTWLKSIVLWDISLCNTTLSLSHMTQLKKLVLRGVDANALSALTKLTQLKMLELWGISLGNTMSNMTHLERLVLRNVDCVRTTLTDVTSRLKCLVLWDIRTDNSINVSHMQHLDRLTLFDVYMSADGWRKFLSNLLCIKHRLHCKLEGTDIDDASVKIIRSSTEFQQFQLLTDRWGNKVYEFYIGLAQDSVTAV